MNSSSTPRFPPLVIVTGASSNHFLCLQSLLWTISKFEPDAKVIVYDLGLTADEHASLLDAPPFYLNDWQLRTFDFTKYPPHFSMSENAGRMAFRPTALADVAHELLTAAPQATETATTSHQPSTLLWLDAGCQLRESLDEIRTCVKRNGVYCACAPGTIASMLYHAARKPLTVTEDLLSKPIRDAGVCGFNIANEQATTLLDQWASVAIDKNCTAPEGSTRRTHRQDAVFAVLLNQAANINGWTLEGRRLRGLAIKQDNVTLKETKFRVGDS